MLSCHCTEDVIIVPKKTQVSFTQSPSTLAHHLAYKVLKDLPALMAQMANKALLGQVGPGHSMWCENTVFPSPWNHP